MRMNLAHLSSTRRGHLAIRCCTHSSLSLSVCLSINISLLLWLVHSHWDGIVCIDAGPICPNESKGHVLLGWAKACLVSSSLLSLSLLVRPSRLSFSFDYVLPYRPRFAQRARLGHILSTARDTPFLPCRSHCRFYLGLSSRLLLYLTAFGPTNAQQGSQECEFASNASFDVS